MGKMKKNFKRLISTIAVLSMLATLFAGFSTTASAAVEGDESNKAFDYCVIDNKFSEININSLKGSYPDGYVVLPPSPWTIKTAYGWSNDNAQAVRASYKNIGGNAPYLKGLWTHDGTLGGGAYGEKLIRITDEYLNGNFAVELKYIPYNIAQFSNGNYYGALANNGTGFVRIGLADHKYEGQSGSWGKSVFWDFSHENNSIYPKGVGANPCDMNSGTQSAVGAFNCRYNYASGSGINPTIPATTEELPEGFDGYHYARLEFSTDTGVTVLTRRGENTPWKKATIATNGFDYVMRQLRVPENNKEVYIGLYRGIVGVDSVKVYKMKSELDEADKRFDVNVINQKFSEIKINDLKGSYPDNTQVLPPAPWNIGTGAGGWSFDNADAVRKSYENVGSGDKAYLKGLWTRTGDLNPAGKYYGEKKIQLYNNQYLNGNFAIELKCIPFGQAQIYQSIGSSDYFGCQPSSAYLAMGVEKYALSGDETEYGQMYWDFGAESSSFARTGVGAYTDVSQANPTQHTYIANYSYDSGSGLTTKLSAATNELPADFTDYQYLRLEFTKDKGVTVLSKIGADQPWRKANISSGNDIMSNVRIPGSNGAIYFNLHWNIIGLDSVKVYKFGSDLANSVDSFEFTEDAEGLKATASLTNHNKSEGWNVMLFTAIFDGNRLVGAKVTPDTIVKGTQKTISTPVDTSKYQEGYEIKAFLWEADGLRPLGGVLPLEQ